MDPFDLIQYALADAFAEMPDEILERASKGEYELASAFLRRYLMRHVHQATWLDAGGQSSLTSEPLGQEPLSAL